jgi:hypothetical protein
MPFCGGYDPIMKRDIIQNDGERQDIERDQDDEERERKGEREAATKPADRRDPRGDQEPPQPFSGPTR